MMVDWVRNLGLRKTCTCSASGALPTSTVPLPHVACQIEKTPNAATGGRQECIMEQAIPPPDSVRNRSDQCGMSEWTGKISTGWFTVGHYHSPSCGNITASVIQLMLPHGLIKLSISCPLLSIQYSNTYSKIYIYHYLITINFILHHTSHPCVFEPFVCDDSFFSSITHEYMITQILDSIFYK